MKIIEFPNFKAISDKAAQQNRLDAELKLKSLEGNKEIIAGSAKNRAALCSLLNKWLVHYNTQNGTKLVLVSAFMMNVKGALANFAKLKNSKVVVKEYFNTSIAYEAGFDAFCVSITNLLNNIK